MAESSQNSDVQSVTVTETTDNEAAAQRLVLKLKKPKTDRKVQWEEGTVDNEFMNKKKSKCCCIYEKPRMFGESSSEDSDDDCSAHCRGHKKKCPKHDSPDGASGSGGSNGGGAGIEGGIASS